MTDHQMPADVTAYHAALSTIDRAICTRLYEAISTHLPEAENKVWHRHPVWFLKGNPIVGYDKLKDGVRLMFWSGADFGEEELRPRSGKFKDASVRYRMPNEVDPVALARWLGHARTIQWDYKNIVKRKGVLLRLEV
jgi:hypothetical protein